MPTFEIQTPEGKTYEVDARDMAHAQEAIGLHMGAQGKPKTDTTQEMGEGIARHVAKGVPILGGLANKAEAATEAALAPVVEPMLPEGLGQRINAPTFKERYDKALAIQEGMDTGFEERHPVVSGAAELAGGVGAFGGAARIPAAAKAMGLTAPTLPGMIAGGIASGAPIGALDAATRGENPVAGGVIGGVAGAAGPVLGEVAGAAIRPWTRAATAARTPEIEAAQQITKAYGKDVGKGLTPQEVREGLQRDQPLAVMDVAGGRATQRLARRAANVSPEAQETFDNTIFGRFQGQSKRTGEFVQGLSEFGDAHEMQQALHETRQSADSINYRAAMEEGQKGVWNDRLGQLISHPWVRKAIPEAIEESNAEAVLNGLPSMKNPFIADANGNLSLPKGPNGETIKPTLEFWNALKKNIDGKIDQAMPAAGGKGDTNTVRMGENIKKALLGQVDEIVPKYKEARATSAKFFGASDALQAGREAVRPGTAASRADNRVLRDNMAKMTETERKLFTDGAVDEMAQTLLATPNNQNILNKIDQSEKAKERLFAILGKKKYDNLEAYLRVEGHMDRFRTAMGNSTTAMQHGDMAEGSVTQGLSISPRRMIEDMLSKAVDKFGRGIDEKVAAKIADMLTSTDGKEYAKAVRMIANNKKLMGAFGKPAAARGAIGVRGAAPMTLEYMDGGQ
jgi:hypothetical protein